MSPDQPTARDTWDALLCETNQYGTRSWYDENGNFHRENGPALITSLGTQYWYKHGLRHREDGPAVMHPNGYVEYWIDCTRLTEEEFNEWKKSNARK